ncbi:hypothetical protein ALQ84_200039 [Pseudomonas caricapapayae]|uniref:Uncharacterized protein n=1 Tax=Pseudomonas caricapapayae TaxID=46678 RepID=A0A3M3AZT3_9PSED|nr:hypothetical protein ALQ84_200039 [Pseudomonas caricapapayae]RMV96405.1 hypothetical protein ALP01_200354 [Pseudomonas caricapapayae]
MIYAIASLVFTLLSIFFSSVGNSCPHNFTLK